jgi:hypothetical protein
MDDKPTPPPDANEQGEQEAKGGEVPPTKDPKKAAGSLNPKEKTAFYEAVAKKTGKRKQDRFGSR